MKLKCIFIMLCVTLMVNAQHDSLILRQYEVKIEENTLLKQRVNNLKKDSAGLSGKIVALQKKIEELERQGIQTKKQKFQNKEFEERIKRMVSDSAKQSKTIDNLKQENDKYIKQKETLIDSIAKLNEDIKKMRTTLNKTMSLNDSISALKRKLGEQENHLSGSKRLHNYVTGYFKDRNASELFKMTEIDYVKFCVALYDNMDVALPKSIQDAQLLYNAECVLKQKYSKTEVDKQINLVKSISNTSSRASLVYKKLCDYQTINNEAATLWDRMSKRVEENRKNGFMCLNIQRQLWQTIQTYINDHPNMQYDYPYIYDELQHFLAESWKVQNDDIEKIFILTKSNPFK